MTANFAELAALVTTSGFLDGIHPCGFAVLLFFIAFLLSIKRSKTNILLIGGAYIAGVFLTYFLIGLGILKAISLFPGHFFAIFGSLLLIVIGLISILDGIRGTETLVIPKMSKPWINDAIQKATFPAALLAGILVGLCAFPCAGGIYLAVLGFLTVKATFLEGVGFLVLYNVFFVMPLILTLLFASNEKVLEKLETLEHDNRKNFKFLLGGAAIALSAFILYSVLK
ncbi:hypothetical protein HY994_00565 [Candidatus Micrarchaeota archaeon]|nr:hypothetical protein [Candidatus Micrarchaeota archaeon]